jgi:hypothetical protein
MNIGETLHRAFKTAWQLNQYWIIGFLLGPTLLGVKWPTPAYDPSRGFPWEMMGRILILASLAGLFLMFVTALLHPIIVIVVRERERGSFLRIGEVVKQAMDYYGRCLLLGFGWLFISLISLAVFAIPVIGVFAVSLILGMLVAMLAVVCLIPLALVYLSIVAYSYRFAIIENVPAMSAIPEAVTLFRRFKGKSFGVSLSTFAIRLGIVWSISMLILAAQVIALFPVLALGEVMDILTTVVGIFISFCVSVVTLGFTAVFESAAWTMSFLQLRESEASVPEVLPPISLGSDGY